MVYANLYKVNYSNISLFNSAYGLNAMQNFPYPPLFNQWQNYQKSYMDTWQSMAGNGLPQMNSANPWAAAMENWWNTASINAKPQAKDMFSMLVDQGKTFFDLSSQLSNTLTEAFKTQDSAAEFEDMVSKSFEGLRENLSASASTAPMEFLENIASQSFFSNGDFIPKMLEQMQSESGKLMSMPGVGMSREKQEKIQRLARLVTEYTQASGEYMNVQNAINKKSVDMLQKRFVEMYERKEQPESCRAIYDNWVDCYEEVYAEEVMKPDYNAAYGEMVNSLMALTKAHREIQDETLEMLGIPSRREVDTLLERFQQERREKHKMRAEIEALKTQIGALADTKPVPAAKTAATKPKVIKPATPRKKVATKSKSISAKAVKKAVS